MRVILTTEEQFFTRSELIDLGLIFFLGSFITYDFHEGKPNNLRQISFYMFLFGFISDRMEHNKQSKARQQMTAELLERIFNIIHADLQALTKESKPLTSYQLEILELFLSPLFPDIKLSYQIEADGNFILKAHVSFKKQIKNTNEYKKQFESTLLSISQFLFNAEEIRQELNKISDDLTIEWKPTFKIVDGKLTPGFTTPEKLHHNLRYKIKKTFSRSMHFIEDHQGTTILKDSFHYPIRIKHDEPQKPFTTMLNEIEAESEVAPPWLFSFWRKKEEEKPDLHNEIEPPLFIKDKIKTRKNVSIESLSDIEEKYPLTVTAKYGDVTYCYPFPPRQNIEGKVDRLILMERLVLGKEDESPLYFSFVTQALQDHYSESELENLYDGIEYGKIGDKGPDLAFVHDDYLIEKGYLIKFKDHAHNAEDIGHVRPAARPYENDIHIENNTQNKQIKILKFDGIGYKQTRTVKELRRRT